MSESSIRRLRLINSDTEKRSTTGGSPLRVAVATQDLRTINAHFAGARSFAIYDVTPEDYHFVEAIHFDAVSKEDGVHADANEDRITPRADALKGCALLFVLAIGGPAAAKVVNRRIHPLKLPHPEPIDQVLRRVQAMLKTSPPPWLRKAMVGEGGRKMDFLDDDIEERA